ncbi:MAG: Gfo/Idh/MocA family oxidoreductase, partial [Candidatus Binatia bacterium]
MDKKTLRGAVIGYGFVSAQGHVPAYLKRSQRDVEIVALADISPVRRDLAQAALPRANIYNDYRSLLDAEAACLDFIDISTPPCDHAAVAHAALDNG